MEIDHIFIGYWEGETISPNPEEVETLQWHNLDQTLSEMNKYLPYLKFGLRKD